MRHPLDVLAMLLIAAACLALLLTAASVRPDPRGLGTHERLGLEPCGYLATTGRPCPTCGMTTSFSRMVRLDVVGALSANPAGAVLCILCVVVPLSLFGAWRHAEPLGVWLARKRPWFVLLALSALVLASWGWKLATAR